MNIHNFQIELVEGCTRRCEFCGINQILDKVSSPNYMTIDTAQSIANQIKEQFKDKIRIEFAVHGEPLLHPKVSHIIQIFRHCVSKSQLSVITNGDPLLKTGLINSIFEAGLNFLMVDFYDDTAVERNHRVMEIINQSGIEVKDFYVDGASIWSYQSPNKRQIIVTPPLDQYSGNKKTREVHTAGGNLPMKVWKKYGKHTSQFPIYKACAKPFREMTINYDGNVSICCEDWRRQATISNIHDEKIVDIWNSELFNKYRYILYHKRRDLIDLCKWCDERSFRTGLLKLDKEYPELIDEPFKTNENRLL